MNYRLPKFQYTFFFILMSLITMPVFGQGLGNNNFQRDTTKEPYVHLNGLNWTTENYAGESFSNGDPIRVVTSVEEWVEANKNGEPACASYDFDSSNDNLFGKFYNGHAVKDERGIGGDGFRLPTKEEYDALQKFLIKNKMEIYSETAWQDVTDLFVPSGFDALPTGFLDKDGSFAEAGLNGYLWTSTVYDGYNSHAYMIYPSSRKFFMYHYVWDMGMPVRLVKE